MKFLTGLLAAVLLIAGMGASHAVVRIADDRGGRIGTYVDKYQDLRQSGDTVIIDGLCASACTIVLGAIPHDRICVTSHATLGFHAAWDFGANGRAVTNTEATQMLYAMYPSQVKRWINQRGGLTPHMLFLQRQAAPGHVQALLPRRAGLGNKPLCAGSPLRPHRVKSWARPGDATFLRLTSSRATSSPRDLHRPRGACPGARERLFEGQGTPIRVSWLNHCTRHIRYGQFAHCRAAAIRAAVGWRGVGGLVVLGALRALVPLRHARCSSK